MNSKEYLEQYLKINNLKKDMRQESQEIEKLDNLQQEIKLSILSLDDKEQSRILFLKYILGFSMIQISQRMFMSRMTVFRKYKKGLEKIKVGTLCYTF